MITAYKYRIYPTGSQIYTLQQDFGNSRALYNQLLHQYNIERESHLLYSWFPNPSCTKFSFTARIPALKAQFSYLTLTYSKSLQLVAGDLAIAFDRFFKKTSKYPKFKK